MSFFNDEDLKKLDSISEDEKVSFKIEGKTLVFSYKNDSFEFPLVLTVNKVRNLPDLEKNPLDFLVQLVGEKVNNVSSSAIEYMTQVYSEALNNVNGAELGK